MIKVLVAEDDEVLASLLVRSLTNEHFDAHAAYDGIQTELEIKTWYPDIVLLDLLMPNKDGFGVLSDVRADSQTLKLPIIVFSNLGESETIARVKKFGVTEYFIKANTTPREVIAKIKTMFPG